MLTDDGKAVILEWRIGSMIGTPCQRKKGCCDMRLSTRLLGDYEGITRYAGVPTEQTTGRLHYNENCSALPPGAWRR